MKLGKEFTSQMVPEWEPAYMNYTYLKSILKDILIFRRRQQQHRPHSSGTPSPAKGKPLKRRVSLYRAFSGLTNRYGHYSNEENEDEVILVGEMQPEGRSYRAVFLRSLEDGGEKELVFFRRLDDEFNKVVSFYRCKVAEAEELNKQMDALIALRIETDNRHFRGLSAPSNSVLTTSV